MEKFTRIENDVIEKLISINLSGSALACAFLLLRKTNGYHKEQDGISLSQFCNNIKRSKPTVIKALKELQLVNICILVKKGNSGKQYNIYSFNKDTTTWQLVRKPLLVKKKKSTSKEKETQLVKKPLHTKEIITKETRQKKGPNLKTLTSLKNGEITKHLSDTEQLEYLFIEIEVKKMLDWLRDNPNKKYKNYLAFARNWVRRTVKSNKEEKQVEYMQEEQKKWEVIKEQEKTDSVKRDSGVKRLTAEEVMKNINRAKFLKKENDE